MTRDSKITPFGITRWEDGEKEIYQQLLDVSPDFKVSDTFPFFFELNRDIMVKGNIDLLSKKEFSNWCVYRDLHGSHKFFQTLSQVLAYLDVAVEDYYFKKPLREDANWELP